MKWLLAQEAEGQRDKVLRLRLKPGGCQGFSYEFDLEDAGAVGPTDVVSTRDGMSVVVDEGSMEHIDGATVDFHVEMKGSAFVVKDNPKADLTCSCGSSFSPKS